MVSQLVQNELRRADLLRQEFEGLVFPQRECTLDERGAYLLAYWSLAIEHHVAMVVLIERQLYGSAAALLRPIVEAVVRGHLVLFCSEEVLAKIRKDDYRVNFSTVGKDIDAQFGLQTFLQDFLRESSRIMHSYAHGGILPVQRRFEGDNLRPNYQEDELVGLIYSGTAGLCLLTNTLTQHLKCEDGQKQAAILYAKWCRDAPAV